MKQTKNLLSTPSKSFGRGWLIIAIAVIFILSLTIGLVTPVSAGSIPTSYLATTYITFLPITQSAGSGFYVSPQGNDHNPGTFDRPWRTLSKAAESVVPGNVVYVRGGIYQEAVDFSISGTSSAPISIIAYPNETPVIDGNNYQLPNVDGGSLLEISGDYVTVSGFEVRYSSYLGVEVAGVHSVADKINAHHNLHSGMRISGDYGVVQNSLVWSNDMQNFGGKYPAGDSTGLTASRHPNYAMIMNNIVYGNWGIGMSTYESNGTILRGNTVYDNYGVNVYISNATNVTFDHNFIYATGAMTPPNQIGIQMEDENVPNPQSANITIVNNIVYSTDRSLAVWHGVTGKMINVLISNNTFVNSTEESNVIFSEGLLFESVRFINNLVVQDGNLPIIMVQDSHPGLSFSNNLWSQPPIAPASGPGDIIGNPLLAHLPDPYHPEWFKLTLQSPAIGKAIYLQQVNIDYFGITRVAPPDIGASEFFSSP